MNWPLPQDFNEAVQNPASAFSDPDLKTGQTIVGPTGLPLPRSGNFADVYQVRAVNQRDWAVKCFTRPVTGLEQRYKKVEDALERAGLPFTIGFTFLNEGVLVRGKWMPAVKMEWVDGLLVNQVARDQAANAKTLDALCQMWSRLCKRLREAGIAHADIQHGNVLLVPGSKAGSYTLKLIDYDGMYVPALANTPSGESGHPNYQHPLRAAKQVYSPDLDRFPHLVIATAFKALAVLGTPLWERYDTGDNMLFTEEDFKAPANSKLVKELWESKNLSLKALVGHLAIACGRPIPQTPWLDQIAPDGIAIPLSVDQMQAAESALGFGPKPIKAGDYGVELVEVAPPPAPVVNAFAGFDADEPAPEPLPRSRSRDRELEHEPRRSSRREPERKSSAALPIAIAAGVVLILGAVAAGVVIFGGKKGDEVVQKNPDDDRKEEKKDDKVKGKVEPHPKLPVIDPNPPIDPGSKPPDKDPIIPPMNVGLPPADGRINLDPFGVPEMKVRWETTGPGAVKSLRFTPNGDWLIVTDNNLTPIRVFSAATGTSSVGFKEGVTNPVDFACLANGHVVSWHVDQPFAIVWNPGTGKGVGKIPIRSPGFEPGPHVFDVSPDGHYYVVGHAAPNGAKDLNEVGHVSVIDTSDSKEVLKLEVRGPKFQFVKNDELLVADLNLIKAYKLPRGNPSRQALSLTNDAVGKILATSADGFLVLHPGKGQREVRLIDYTKPGWHGGLPNGQFPNHFFGSAGAISNNGRFVALCSFPRRGENTYHLEVIDVVAGKLAGRYLFGTNGLDVHSIAFSPDNLAVAVGRNRKVQVFDLPKDLVAVAPKKEPDPGPAPGIAPGLVPASPDPAKISIQKLASIPSDPKLSPTRMAFSQDGRTVILGSLFTGEMVTYDIRTATAGPGFTGHADKKFVFWFGPLPGGKVWSVGKGEPAASLWDPKTGQASDKITFPEVGGNDQLQSSYISPDGRYAVRAQGSLFQGNTYESAPLKLIDVKTSKEILSLSWQSGSVHFTADSSRVLLLDTYGRGRWFKLPSGEADGEWTHAGPQMGAGGISALAMSWDGLWLLCAGSAPGLKNGHFLLDARTGRVARLLGEADEFASQKGALSADGKLAALVKISPQGAGELAIVETATGRVIDKTPIGDRVTWDSVVVGLAPDGRTAAAFVARGNLSTFELSNAPLAVVPKKEPTPMPKMKDPEPPMKVERKPLPDDASIAKAEMKLHSMYKDEYAKKLPAERRALAIKLLGLIEDSADDAAMRYVLYRDVRDIAMEVSDPALAMQALESIIRLYEVDAQQMKLAAFEKMKDLSGNDTARRTVAELAIASSDVAAAHDDYPMAMKFAQVAIAAAKKGNLPAAFVDEVESQLTKAQKSAELFAPVKSALDRLKENPADEDAAFVVGRYRCFTQGRWEDGIKPLAKGSSGALKTAAELDAMTPRGGPVDLKLGDSWWAAAQATAPDAEKRAMEYRARYWYARALPTRMGDARAQAETRLSFTAGGTEYRSGLLAEFTAKTPSILQGKKARIDSMLLFNAGEFKAEGVGVATDLAVKWSGTVLPQRPGRYRFSAVATDPVIVRIDGKTVIDTNGKNARRDVLLTLPDKPTLIGVDFKCINTDRHSVKLLWSIPGTETEEPVPPEVLFHDRKSESVLGKP